MRLAGEGVDCINFVMAILEGSGVLPRTPLPFYDERLGSFRARNVMEDLFLRFFHAEAHEPEWNNGCPEFGDVVICKCGRQSNHVGIILDGWFWHVPSKGFCSPEPWPFWQFRAQRLVRFTQIGRREDPAGLRWRDIKGLADRPA